MKEKLKILMLEDVPEDAGLVEHELKKAGIDFTYQRVDCRNDFIDAISSFAPDIILSDHSLPQFNSRDALNICKEKFPEIPFILVTGAVSEEFAVNCLNEGADDYILKSHLRRLPSAIMSSLKKREVEEQRRQAETSLRAQNEQLMKINEELDRFVYSASHDLRAPLKSVLGLVKLVQMDCKRQHFESIEDYMQLIEQSIFKLDLTIKDIIDYSKNTRTKVFKELIDMKKMLKEVFENLQYIDGSLSIDKEIQIDEEVPLVSDENRIKVIFNNIISNAIKYRDTGKENSKIHVRIKISAQKAVFIVEDNGIGIKKQYLDKIFNMFYRATEKSEGSGLGLYIVKETLERLKGTVEVKSEVNKGTTFIFEIPNHYKKTRK